MRHRALVLALASVLLSAAAARPEGVAIDHHSVGCVVAGKFPRLNACFAPASQLARARVYFRVADGPAEWYYVEMKSDAPCFSGVLPRPKKALVGRRLQYYLNALDRGFAEARTDEAEARIVSKPSDCDAKALVAPMLNSAAVAVFPGVPAGFAGAAGLGVGATAAIVGGGAALAGGGIAAAASSSSSSSGASGSGGPTTTTSPPATFPPTTTTTTTTTTTLLGWSPVFRVLKGGVEVSTDVPITGPEPLVLDFDMCASKGPYPLRFDVEVDGSIATTACRSTLTFTGAGVRASGARGPVHASATRSFDVRMHIRSQAQDSWPQAGKRITVQVDSGSSPCLTDKTGPTVVLNSPTSVPSPGPTPSPYPYPVQMRATASDGPGGSGVAYVEYKVSSQGPVTVAGTGTTTPDYPYDWTQVNAETWAGPLCVAASYPWYITATVQAYAVDVCGNGAYSTNTATININCSFIGLRGTAARAGETATWMSDLALTGGSGQVVVNGEVAFPRAGRTPISARTQRGENRVEATLVEGRTSGTWRFELGAVAGLRPDSLRVVAGDVVQSGGDALVFRLQGRPGERIVFSFVAGE